MFVLLNKNNINTKIILDYMSICVYTTYFAKIYINSSWINQSQWFLNSVKTDIFAWLEMRVKSHWLQIRVFGTYFDQFISNIPVGFGLLSKDVGTARYILNVICLDKFSCICHTAIDIYLFVSSTVPYMPWVLVIAILQFCTLSNWL